MKKVFIDQWEIGANDKVLLTYSDGDVVIVEREDFIRAMGAIINATKEDVIRDFAVETIPHK